MTIHEIVEQALKNGFLTPTMEADVGRLCESANELSLEEYMGLDRLMGALLTGEVTAMPRRQFINVMEELVVTETISRIAAIEDGLESKLDVGHIAAYALNRLPPLYATSEQGAEYQRQRAKKDLAGLIAQRVEEGIQQSLARPNVDRDPLGSHASRKDTLDRLTDLLTSYAD